MAPTFDIISELYERNGQLPASEKKVADYVLKNLEEAVHSTLSQIADASGVSVATVNRFCHSLGCDGFKDFKIRLAQNVAVGLKFLNDTERKPASSDALVSRVFDVIIDGLNMARDQLSPELLEQSIKKLAGANRIVFMGVGGGSSNVAAEGANRFFRLGIPSEAERDGYRQRMLASTFGPNDVLFAISSTGLPKSLLDSVQIAQQYGASSICITQPGSPLSQACDIALSVDYTTDTDVYKPTSTRLIFTAIIDVLATGVALTRPEETREMLRRIQTSVSAIHNSTAPQPVGD